MWEFLGIVCYRSARKCKGLEWWDGGLRFRLELAVGEGHGDGGGVLGMEMGTNVSG